ncbi:YezD family protein [Neobacillus pocheonensis]|uniref:YezD family protein n=1 Tax=Neobacillus pocheonensis TaxID=363869 RepID=UPI003D2CFE00
MAVVDQAKANFILSTLKNMEYGSVIITVHDGTITQIDKTEKTRFAASKSSPVKNKK